MIGNDIDQAYSELLSIHLKAGYRLEAEPGVTKLISPDGVQLGSYVPGIEGINPGLLVDTIARYESKRKISGSHTL